MSLRVFTGLVGFVGISMVLAAPAAAAPITYQFAGVLDFVPEELESQFEVGQAFSGIFQYEGTTPPRDGSTSTFAFYDGLISMSLSIGSYSASATGPQEIQVDNDPGGGFHDRFAIGPGVVATIVGDPVNGLALESFGVRLDDEDDTVFSDALILPLTLNLDDFELRSFGISFGGDPAAAGPSIQQVVGPVFASGVITSLVLIPEPSSLALSALAGLSLLGSVARRHRR